MRASTIAHASGAALLVYGNGALRFELLSAQKRLERVTGWSWGGDFQMHYEKLPRTGDDIKIKVIWHDRRAAQHDDRRERTNQC